MIIIIAIFLHEHSNFIEDNEEFKLGGEDLEKFNNFSKIQQFFKNFKILNSKNSYFPNFYHSSPPLKSWKFEILSTRDVEMRA